MSSLLQCLVNVLTVARPLRGQDRVGALTTMDSANAAVAALPPRALRVVTRSLSESVMARVRGREGPWCVEYWRAVRPELYPLVGGSP
jgi:hypothetical protein